jgi:hypothetical protein
MTELQWLARLSQQLNEIYWLLVAGLAVLIVLCGRTRR